MPYRSLISSGKWVKKSEFLLFKTKLFSSKLAAFKKDSENARQPVVGNWVQMYANVLAFLMRSFAITVLPTTSWGSKVFEVVLSLSLFLTNGSFECKNIKHINHQTMFSCLSSITNMTWILTIFMPLLEFDEFLICKQQWPTEKIDVANFVKALQKCALHCTLGQ